MLAGESKTCCFKSPHVRGGRASPSDDRPILGAGRIGRMFSSAYRSDSSFRSEASFSEVEVEVSGSRSNL